MLHRVLLLIQEDPRSSPRPAEAIRVAAGLSPWEGSQIDVYLQGPAVLLLSSAPDLLIDEDNVRRYLPLLAEHGCCAYMEPGQRFLTELDEAALPVKALATEQLASLAAASDLVLRF